ncbi:MAG: TonB-dependent receptor [Bacteroidales bacterium]
MKPFLIIFYFILFTTHLLSQTITQTVRGKVIDGDTRRGLAGANVIVVNSQPLIGATTDMNGNFKLENVPVGRTSVQVSFMGYRPMIKPEILVSSGKETILVFELTEEVIQAKEVEIKAWVDKDRPVNVMAMVSARSFSVEESRRYAGSVDDPMRAVSNFAGVAGNPEVGSNEIIIRGNSPKGLLWRVDGMDIPNPNHFAYVGTSGGGFTMFSSQVLSNSDFYTAAFPAEYGNALSGVFDMRFRNGNNARHEFAVQLGVQGLDVSAEGPFLHDKPASFLFNYRYSVLAFLQYIDPGMKNRIPSFQDLSFKINLPTGKAGTFSIVGIGGISYIQAVPVKDSTQWETLEDRSQSSLDNRMGALALVHQVNLTRKSYLRSFLSFTYNYIRAENSYLTPSYQLLPQDDVMQSNFRGTVGTLLNQKFGRKHTNRSGISFMRLFYNSDIKTVNPLTGIYSQVNQGSGNSDLLQAFSESKIEVTNEFSVNAGLYFQYFLLNRHYSIEPRLAVRWQFAGRHAFSLGYGKHSLSEDVGVYLIEIQISPGVSTRPNQALNFSRAHHLVFGYDFLIRPDLRLKVESYFQYLYDIPVIPGSYYSQINSNGGYFSETLINDGTGRNAGIDITLEKFLTRQYYYLVTVSLFDSKYKGGDGIERSTRFNSNLVINLLGGKEWTIRKKNILGVNLKVSYTGGEYYVPIDLQSSKLEHREVLDEAQAYIPRLPGFCYVDFTLTYRTNHKKFSGIWALQIKNLLNQKPATGYVYNDFTQAAEKVVSIGILPLVSYKIEF